MDKKQDNWKDKIDWTKKDNVLSKELGFSREYIRQLRKAKGLPSSALIQREEPYFKVNLKNADWGSTNIEIAQQNYISTSSVSAQRKFWAPQTVKKYGLRDYLKNVDWSLKHKEIQSFLWQNFNIETCQTNISRYKRIFAPKLMQVKNRKEVKEDLVKV